MVGSLHVGLDRQPNDFSCGPWALKHALSVLGIIADPARIARLAETHWWSGTDEVHLARAARAHGCDMPLLRRRDPNAARKLMVKHLQEGYPVLTCVDSWEHWIVVVGHSRGRFVALDSVRDPVVIVLSWRELEERWVYDDDDDEYDDDDDDDDDDHDDRPTTIYDMFPLRPRFRREVRADFSPARARALRRPENKDLALYWDSYVEDVQEICRPRSPHHVEPLSMGEFLRRNRDALVARVVYWHGGVERDDVRRIMRNLRFVADTYGMVIPAAATRRALADVAILLTLWAAGKVPLDPLYARKPKRRSPSDGTTKKTH